MYNIFFLDTETTSQDSTKARVVQMAIVAPHISEDGMSIKYPSYKGEWYSKPPCDIEIGAIATHHITPRMLEEYQEFSKTEGYHVLKNRLHMGHILVAHNAPYDVAVLENEGMTITSYIDTLRVSRHLLESESYSLQYLRYQFNLDDEHIGDLNGGFAHSALYDTICLSWLYDFLLDKIDAKYPGIDPVEKMLELTRTPVEIKTFKFGKHKDKLISDVVRTDPHYIEWLYREETKKPKNEQNEDMVYTLRRFVYT